MSPWLGYGHPRFAVTGWSEDTPSKRLATICWPAFSRVIRNSQGVEGEALALEWDDIDWKARTVTIQRTMAGEASSRSTNPPKTKRGRRVVSLSPYLVDIIRGHQERQHEEHMAAGTKWAAGGASPNLATALEDRHKTHIVPEYPARFLGSPWRCIK